MPVELASPRSDNVVLIQSRLWGIQLGDIDKVEWFPSAKKSIIAKVPGRPYVIRSFKLGSGSWYGFPKTFLSMLLYAS